MDSKLSLYHTARGPLPNYDPFVSLPPSMLYSIVLLSRFTRPHMAVASRRLAAGFTVESLIATAVPFCAGPDLLC
jgi:hypothetical protein